MEKDITTEERIKEAARKLFQQKGYGMTKSRDIAEEAGINLALLNYYFRSKEKLFELIMGESLHNLIAFLSGIMNNEKLSLPEMIDRIVEKYIDLLIENPNLPLFVLGQIQADPGKFIEKSGFPLNIVKTSRLQRLLEKQIEDSGLKEVSPTHIIINVVSMTIFPFIGKPLLLSIFGLDEESYWQFISERRKLIPKEIKTFLKMEI